MSFVTEDQVKGRCPFPLRLLDDAERLVGAEDNRHRFRTCHAERHRDFGGVRGHRDLELMQRCVLVFAPSGRVGADPDVAVWHRLLGRPFPHRLSEQRDRRHQVQRPAADACDRFRYPQRDKGLAGAACHDQLAAVMRLEAFDHIGECGLLMWPQAERLVLIGQVLRFVASEIRPVERAAGQIAEAKHKAPGLEMLDGLTGGRPPFVAGVHNDTGRERFARRGGDERIELGLRDSRARGVALALNGAVAPAVSFLGNQIDPRIGAVEVGTLGCPLGPQPDRGEPLPVDGVLGEVGLHQPFEQASLVSLRLGDSPYVVQGPLKAVVHNRLRSTLSRCLRQW